MDNLFQPNSSITMSGNISFVRKTSESDNRHTPHNTSLQITQETMLYCQACRRTGSIPSLNTGMYEVCIDCLCKYVIQQAPKRDWKLEDYIIVNSCNIILIYYNNTYYLTLSRDLTIRYTIDICENFQRITNNPREINSVQDVDWHTYGNANDIALYLFYFKHTMTGYGRSHYVYVNNYDITGTYNHKTAWESKDKSKRLITCEEYSNAHQFYDTIISLYDFNANVDTLYIKLFGKKDIQKIEQYERIQKQKIFKNGRHYYGIIGTFGIYTSVDPNIRTSMTITPSVSTLPSATSLASSTVLTSASSTSMDVDSHYDLYETSLDNSLLD